MDNSGGDDRRRTQRLLRIHERRGGFEGRNHFTKYIILTKANYFTTILNFKFEVK